jgi:hypothetical protein
MLLNGRARDQIFFAKFGFYPARGEVLLCAVSLNAARRTGDAGLGIEGECVVNGKSKIAVAAGRDKSRRVGGCHGLMITRRPSTWRGLSPRFEILLLNEHIRGACRRLSWRLRNALYRGLESVSLD